MDDIPTRKSSLNEERGCLNTDRELWRAVPDDYYAPSIHVTKEGAIGINVGGLVIVMPVEKWHALAAPSRYPLPSGRSK